MIDALPEAWWPVAVAVTVALLDDPLAAECATSATRRRARSLEQRGARCAPRSRARGRGALVLRRRAARARAAGRRRRDHRCHRGVRGALRPPSHAALPTTCSTIGPDAPSPAPSDVVTKAEIVASLEESRRRTLGLLAPVPDAEQRAQVSELMSPLCWDLAHIGHYEELWLVRELADADRRRRRLRRRVRRVQAPAARPADARHPRRRPARARSMPTCEPGCSRCSTPSTSIGDASAARRRVRLRHGRAARAPARRDPAGHAPAHGRLRAPRRRRRRRRPGADVAAARRPARRRARRPAGEHVLGTDTDAVGLRQRAARHDRRARRRSGSTPPRSPTPRTPSSSTPAATTTARPGPRRGGRGAPKPELAAPQFWTRDTAGGWVRRRFGRTEPVPAARAGAARVLVRGRRVTRAGPGHACPPKRSGRRPRRARRSAGADLWRDGPRRFAPAPVGTTADVVSDARGARDARRGVGVDRVRLPGVPGVPVVPVPRVLGGVLRPRLQGAARRVVGDAPVGRAHHVPQLGLPDPPADLRRLPLRRATPDPPMCRHLAYLGPTVGVDDLLFAAPHSLPARRSVPATRRRGPPTPTAGVSPGTTRRRTSPHRYRTVTPIWDDDAFASRVACGAQRRVPRRRAVGVARCHARRHRQRTVRRRSVGVLAQRHRARLPGRVGDELRARSTRAPRRDRERRRHRGALRARAAAPGRRARRRPTPS